MDNSQEDKFKIIEKSKTKITDTSLEVLLDLIRAEDLEIRLSAIEALSLFQDFTKATCILIELTKDLNSEVRYYAIDSLRYFSGEDVIKAIINSLKDPTKLVRVLAAQALGDFKSKIAATHLQKALLDENELVRSYAAEAIGKIGNKDYIIILEERLKEETRNLARLGFYIGLYKLGKRHFLDFILKLLKSKSYKVRCATANILVELADSENFALIINSLQKALTREKTIAAQSSISNALAELKRHLS